MKLYNVAHPFSTQERKVKRPLRDKNGAAALVCTICKLKSVKESVFKRAVHVCYFAVVLTKRPTPVVDVTKYSSEESTFKRHV